MTENHSPDPDTVTVPAGFVPPRWITGPRYSRRELEFLAVRLQESNSELRQSLFRLREQLRKETG